MSIAPPQPLVTVSKVLLTLNKKHQVTRITVDMSGPFGASAADSLAAYHLTTAGERVVHRQERQAGQAQVGGVHSVNQFDCTDTQEAVRAFQTRAARVSGLPPTGLTDNSGRLIDGNHDGRAGGDGVMVLGKKGRAIAAAIPTAAAPAASQGPLADLLAEPDSKGTW